MDKLPEPVAWYRYEDTIAGRCRVYYETNAWPDLIPLYGPDCMEALLREKQSAEYWQDEAKRYCTNSDYWRERAEKAEAEAAALRQAIAFYEKSLKETYPYGASGKPYENWNEARKISAAIKEAK